MVDFQFNFTKQYNKNEFLNRFNERLNNVFPLQLTKKMSKYFRKNIWEWAKTRFNHSIFLFVCYHKLAKYTIKRK